MVLVDDQPLLDRFLRQSDFLDCFSFPAQQYARLYHLEAGEYIVEEGVQPAFLYYLVAGRAKLYMTLPNGKVSLIDFFRAPCFVGEMELIGVQRRSRAVQALCGCYCLALSVEECRERLLGDPRFLQRLCVYLGGKNVRTVLSLSQNKGFPLENRLAHFLLLAAPDGWYAEKHTHAAEYLGVSYRHLLYVLADFASRGYLKKEGGGYLLTDRAALVSLAQGLEPPEGG